MLHAAPREPYWQSMTEIHNPLARPSHFTELSDRALASAPACFPDATFPLARDEVVMGHTRRHICVHHGVFSLFWFLIPSELFFSC